MNISEQGIALIKRFEGFSAQAYRCPAGKMTIGYGHVLTPHDDAAPITEPQAHQLLLQDLKPMESAINRLVDVPLSQHQFDALASLVYNIGIGAFAGSTLLRKLNAGEEGVEKEFLRWVYAGKTPLPGLVTRRREESLLFKNNSLSCTVADCDS